MSASTRGREEFIDASAACRVIISRLDERHGRRTFQAARRNLE